MSRIPAFLCICVLLCMAGLVGCKQKAEDQAPPPESQESETSNDVNTSSMNIELEAAPREPTEVAEDEAAGESSEASAAEGPREFELEEVSAFDLPDEIRTRFVMGEYAMLQKQPDESVKAYPGFESNTPLYGSMWIDDWDKADSKSYYHFALDESMGPDRGYDWLYFDKDCDGDLRDEIAQRSMSNPPDGARMPYGSDVTQICFDYLTVQVAANGGTKQKVEVMPRLLLFNNGAKYLCFVATGARKGLIGMGGRKFNAFLGHSGQIGGAFDSPATTLHLLPADNQNSGMYSWTGSQKLMAMHKVGNKLYRFSATPEGNKLFVKPYVGPFGIFEIGAGDRDIKKMSAQGGLESEEAAVPVSYELGKSPSPIGTKSCRLPVGDYLPGYLTITYDDLQITISNNYYSDAGPGIRNKNRVYGIKLRKEETFTLDFSNDPAVVFTSPTKEHRVKRGEELKVEAVLIDPVLDIMIRGLYDASGSGRNSLDPKITITRADGEVMAEGAMPFG